MPPLPVQHVIRRDSHMGRTFTITFILIGTLVLAVCLIWGYYIPKWKQKHQRPSSTRFNCLGGAAKYSTSPLTECPPPYAPNFPGHPAVRGMHKQPSRKLSSYNPRNETPFSNLPRPGETLSLEDLRPTPGTERSIRSRKRPTHDYDLPKTPESLSQLALNSGRCEEDSVATLPEMPAPVARQAGRAPPLTKQLALFPMPASTPSRRFDTLAHPNLLFAKLDQLDPRKDPSKSAESSQNAHPQRSVTLPCTRYGDSRRNLFIRNNEGMKSETGEIGVIKRADSSSKNKSDKESVRELAPVCLRPAPKGKPRTPIETIRTRYDRTAGRTKFIPPRNTSLRRHMTPSTEPLTASASAESDLVASTTTPPTSPPPPANTPMLLPTPLRLRRAGLRTSAGTPTPIQISGKSPSESSMAISPGKLAPFALQKSLRSKRDIRHITGFYHPSMTVGGAVEQLKQARVMIPPRPPPDPIRSGRTWLAPVTSTLPGLSARRALRKSWKCSSLYSRDSKGMSMLHSPTFPIGNSERSGTSLSSPTIENPSPRRASSLELVRKKIDNWDLHTGNLDLSFSPTSLSHRPLSDVGPRSPTFPLVIDSLAPLTPRARKEEPTTFGPTIPVPKICVGRPSDDVFGVVESTHGSGRVLRRVLDMEISTDTTSSRYIGRTAPGGAEWV